MLPVARIRNRLEISERPALRLTQYVGANVTKEVCFFEMCDATAFNLVLNAYDNTVLEKAPKLRHN